MRIALAAVLAAVVSTAAFAQTTEFYVVQDVKTKKCTIVDKKPVLDLFAWRERYCADMRSRVLVGPEDYFDIDPIYRLWIRPDDVRDATMRLNLTPSPRLVGIE